MEEVLKSEDMIEGLTYEDENGFIFHFYDGDLFLDTGKRLSKVEKCVYTDKLFKIYTEKKPED